MQLRIGAAIAVLSLSTAAAADGTVSVRGAYYKEKSTRVTQPMVDADLEAGDDARVNAHFLIDAITSASAASGATGVAFTETRYEFGGTYLRGLGDRFRIGGGGRFSREPDYTSVFLNVRGEMDLAEKNAVLGASLAQGRDEINNAGAQGGMMQSIEGSLDTTLASVSFSQILSRYLVGGLTYDFIYLNGFQENVYRAVPAGGALELERVPETRMRHALFGNLRAYYAPSASTFVVGYRFYIDDWGIIGHTPEVRLIQELGEDVDLHLRYRLYKQSQAEFYKETYDSADPEIEPFLTADEKLANQRTQTFGAKLDLTLDRFGARGVLGKTRTHLLIEYTTQTTSFGNAFAAQVAFTVPFEY